MVAKEISVKRYVVRLNGEEREQLEMARHSTAIAATKLFQSLATITASCDGEGQQSR